MRLALAVLILRQILEVVAASNCPVRSQEDPVMLTNSWRINSDADRSDVGKYFPGYVYRRATSYDVHYCSLLCAKDRKCKSFNYIEKDYKCHINEKDRASSDPPDEDLYQFESQWVPRIKGLIDMKDSTYYSRDYYQLKKPLNDPCLTSSCKEDEVCSPYYVKQGNDESDPVLSYSCQKNKFSLSDFHVQWSHWNAWSQCTTTCGYGIEVRNRTCEDEAKSWKCRGESRQARRCADVPCPQWAAWGIWGECLSRENCGKGEQLRSRTCQGSLELDACIGDPTSSRPCLLPSCKTPHILSNITSGFVFIYDDTIPENSSWKGVCEDPELDSSRKKSIVRTICRGIGFAFGILRDNANETLTTKLYLKPKSCAINETSLMNCNHDGWKEFKDCQKQLNVYCYDAEHYTRNDIQTYKDFSTLCQSKGKQLCSYEETFPHKDIPIITGITGGDSWAPIRDDFNDWVQVGGERGRLAEKHNNLYGPPPWGLDPEEHKYLKGNVYCCSVIFPKWADWTSWADRPPARKCGRKWQFRTRQCLHNKLRPACEGPESEPRLINLPRCGSNMALLNISAGAVFIYVDNDNPGITKWKGVCQHPALTDDAKHRASVGACNEVGYEFGYILEDDEVENPVYADQFYPPETCTENDIFLQQCDNPLWNASQNCSRQFQVHCYEATHYFTNDAKTYEEFVSYCSAKGLQLCTRKEIFQLGYTPIITGNIAGDHWTPVRDAFNNWEYVGNFAVLHRPNLDNHPEKKGNVYCCSFTLSERSADPGWYTPTNGYQYIITSAAQKWEKSREVCQEFGGDLAAAGMRSLNTRRTILNAMPRPSVGSYLIVYIGMTDMVKEREWIWVDGELESNRNWSPGEGNSGDCAIIIWPREGFYDLGCNQNYRAICEKSIF